MSQPTWRHGYGPATILHELRAEIVAVIRQDARLSGVELLDHMPDVIAAPAAIVLPGSPYITSGEQPFGFFEVRHTVVVIAGVAPNADATSELDYLIARIVPFLTSADFSVEQVAEPYAFTSGTAVHLAADITITSTVQFSKEFPE